MSIRLRDKVAVVGVGCSQFGELYQQLAERPNSDAGEPLAPVERCGRPVF